MAELRELQKPLKQSYRKDPDAARIRLSASAGQESSALVCSVDIGRAIYAAQAHAGVGGPGTGACSGDLLLGALAACAQITCQLVAEALKIPVEGIKVNVAGELDLRGTLGISQNVPVGFEEIEVFFDIAAPQATSEQVKMLREKTEQYCVVMQTLVSSPVVRAHWS